MSMRSEYDFSRSVPNPYVNKLKKQISIRIDNDTIEYFKTLAAQTAIPYQSLINLFLAECASKELKPSVLWQNEPRTGRAGRRTNRTSSRTHSDPAGERR
jgi:antitoxin component of RelBE/YafQ-DinJ toxin-antitoxin module